jgi:hypothetical protein
MDDPKLDLSREDWAAEVVSARLPVVGLAAAGVNATCKCMQAGAY